MFAKAWAKLKEMIEEDKLKHTECDHRQSYPTVQNISNARAGKYLHIMPCAPPRELLPSAMVLSWRKQPTCLSMYRGSSMEPLLQNFRP